MDNDPTLAMTGQRFDNVNNEPVHNKEQSTSPTQATTQITYLQPPISGLLNTMSSSSRTYADCVASLRTSLAFLESSVATLDAGVQDFPRLTTVLKTVRVCGFPPTLPCRQPHLQI
jgi:hypothetical protein